jgi:hypothetical protein
MSRWVDRLIQHAVFPALAAVEPSINAALSRDGNSPDTLDSLERLRSVAKFGLARLSATDPVLIPTSAVDNLVPSLNQLKSHVDSFNGSGDVNQINAANSQADTFLVNLNLILVATNQEDLKVLAGAAASYRQTLKKYLSDALAVQTVLQEKAAANDSKIKAIEEALTAEQQRLSSLINEHQSQFSSVQDKRA